MIGAAWQLLIAYPVVDLAVAFTLMVLFAAVGFLISPKAGR